MTDRCPQCGSVAPMDRLIVPQDGNQDPVLCRNSWHPPQAFPVPEGSQYITPTCGAHCGVKDNITGHCNCPKCHNGKRKKEGLKKISSTVGLSVKGVNPS